ncbi:MAG: sigma-70 family RNA polymerase sigma factor [Proteobacteria bacterium]|jgi:RNA polymerase sigma-70 factor (ECF subfamily)|nr:sigma-70 family RNA polymerase sigma factor [Pseudomonadota bacterium]
MTRTSSDDRNWTVEERLRERFVRGLAGDGAEYEAFLRELCGHLRAYLRKRLAGMPDDIEDLVQETLIAVHSRRDTYDRGQPLTAWVHAIARYKIVDLLRTHGPRARATEVFDEDSDLFGSVDNEAALAKRDVARLLERLPERQRLPIVHTRLEGLSVAEAARATGMSESAVKVGVHRGLKALASMIRGER